MNTEQKNSLFAALRNDKCIILDIVHEQYHEYFFSLQQEFSQYVQTCQKISTIEDIFCTFKEKNYPKVYILHLLNVKRSTFELWVKTKNHDAIEKFYYGKILPMYILYFYSERFSLPHIASIYDFSDVVFWKMVVQKIFHPNSVYPCVNSDDYIRKLSDYLCENLRPDTLTYQNFSFGKFEM